MRRLLILIPLVAAACGGGGDEGPISKAEFIDRADTICTRYATEIAAITTPPSIEQYPAYAAEALPLARKQLQELRALPAPEGNAAAQAKAFFDAIAASIELGEQLADAVRRRQTGRIQSVFGRARQTTQQASQLGQSFGFNACARGN